MRSAIRLTLLLAIACSPAATKPSSPRVTSPVARKTAEGVLELCSGASVLCARYADGRAVCWGPSGDRSGLDTERPKLIAENVDDIEVVEGRLWFRQPGKGWASSVIHERFVETPIAPRSDAHVVVLADRVACSQDSSGAVSCELAGSRPFPMPGAANARELLLTWSDDKPWLCGRKESVVACFGMTGQRVEIAKGVRLLARGERLCLQRNDGQVACLRDEVSFEKRIEWDVIKSYPPLRSLAVGSEIGCAELGSGELECWWWKQEYADHADAGMTYAGELRGQPSRISGLHGVSRLSVGEAHACALRSDGSLACWGRVLPETKPPLRVIQQAFTRATAIALGGEHACAIQNERAWCWGDNRHGQLGQPSSTPQYTTPAFIDLPVGVVELALGERHTCVRTVAGKVHCFGDPADGRLGRGGQKSPWLTEVTGVRDATRLRAGSDATCVVEKNQSVKCWGKLDGVQGIDRAVALDELRGASDLVIEPHFICGLIGEGVTCSNRRMKGDVSTPRPRDVAELAGRCLRSKQGEVHCLEWQRVENYEGYRETVVALPVDGVAGAERVWSGASAGCVRVGKQARCFPLPRGMFRSATASGPMLMPETLAEVVDVAFAAHQICAVEANGHVWCAGGFHAPVREAGPDRPWTLTPVAAKTLD